MNYRIYNPETDQKAARRIYREIGWIEDDEGEKSLDLFLQGARAHVKEIDGEAECMVVSVPADMRYQNKTLPLQIVAAVTTSRIARKQGFAGTLTANLIATDAVEGAALSALGIFEQGFYNRLGYGNGSYEHWIYFDPATLNVGSISRPPKRLSADDAEAMLKALHNRQRRHGSVNIHPLSFMQAELVWSKKAFGLGYYAEDGKTLTHFLWGDTKGEHGPYRINMIAYQTRAQFLELMALLKGLGDQVRAVQMREPAHIQLQDLIQTPFRQYMMSEKSEYQARNRAVAYWQMRICDLEACIAATHLRCVPSDGRQDSSPLRFNLSLHDPIEEYLTADVAWRGIGGDYVVTFGADSSVEKGTDSSLPTMTASVGAFTRMWLGVRPASGIAVADDLDAPDELLAALDEALLLPQPHPDWDF